ncbi:hypothetical protein A2U01_0044723, partial [Trifolium medium]|nr:hypothetical protein [Trifolium medium]
MKSIEPTANSSEYQVDNAAAVHMIMESTDFDLGSILCTSLGYTSEAEHPQVVGADDNGGESADEMNQFEDGTHPQQQPPQFH